MQIKTTIRYCLTPVRMALINKSTTTSAGADVEKENPFALLVGMQTGAATVESSMEICQKIKNGSAFRPKDPTSGNPSEGAQNTNLKEHKHPCVHRGIIYNNQAIELAQVSIKDEQIKQLWDIYTMEYYSAIKRIKVYPLGQHGWTWRTLG